VIAARRTLAADESLGPLLVAVRARLVLVVVLFLFAALTLPGMTA
jgi:hypothetical protein